VNKKISEAWSSYLFPGSYHETLLIVGCADVITYISHICVFLLEQRLLIGQSFMFEGRLTLITV